MNFAPLTFLRLLRRIPHIFLAALFVIPLWAAAAVELSPEFTHFTLAGQLAASVRDSGITTADEALASYRRSEFETLPGNLGRGYRQDEVWLAFDLKVTDPTLEYLVVEVGPAFLDRVTAYQTGAGDRLRKLGEAGDQVNKDQLRMQTLKPAFAVQTLGQAHVTVLLNIRTASTQAAIVKLHRAQNFPDQVSTESLLLGSIFSINGLMLLIALAMFVLFRDRIYLLWFSYVIVTAGLWSLNDGLVYRYLPIDHLVQINLATTLLSILSYTLGILLINYLFRLRDLSIWLHKGLIVWSSLAASLSLLGVMFRFSPVLTALLIAGFPLFVIISAAIILQMLRRQREALIHGPPFLIYLALTFQLLLATVGWTAYTEEGFWGWQIAGFLNFVSLQYGMFSRARRGVKESELARIDLLSQLAQKNHELEDKIAERTQHLEQALNDLMLAEAGQRNLLSVASHEFRTPAAMIKASLDSLNIIANQVPPEVAKRLDNIRLTAVRLTDLANNLILQDRLQEQSLAPNKQSIDLGDLVATMVAAYPITMAVKLDWPGNSVRIHADPALIRIALHNLVDNAIAHGNSGAVSVGFARHATMAEIHIADQGDGIPDDVKEKIFERFFNIKGDLSRGLGLSIVRAIARAHDGEVFAIDNTPRGTVMVLRLPKLES
jgi:signal transduction histidine kinase